MPTLLPQHDFFKHPGCYFQPMLKVNKSWTDCVGFGQCFVMVTGVHGGNVDRNRAADWHRNPQVHLPGCL